MDPLNFSNATSSTSSQPPQDFHDPEPQRRVDPDDKFFYKLAAEAKEGYRRYIEREGIADIFTKTLTTLQEANLPSGSLVKCQDMIVGDACSKTSAYDWRGPDAIELALMKQEREQWKAKIRARRERYNQLKKLKLQRDKELSESMKELDEAIAKSREFE